MVLKNNVPNNATFEADQVTVPPWQRHMHKAHPCHAANTALEKCFTACDRGMLKGARAAECYQERQVLQRCLVKEKRWKAPPPKPWYQRWFSSS